MLVYRNARKVVMCDGCFAVIGPSRLVPNGISSLGYQVDDPILAVRRYIRGENKALDACSSNCADKAWKNRPRVAKPIPVAKPAEG